MSKILNKAISIILVMVIIFSAAPLSGFVGIELPDLFSITAKAAESGICGDNLTWTFNKSTGVLTIKGSGKMENYQEYYDAPWYSYGEDVKSIVFPNGITSIGDFAFSYTGVTDITIPNNVTSIGNGAFFRCYDLDNVTISNSVTTIGNGAFDETSISNIIIPNSVTTIGEGAFQHTPLSNITIPNSVITIGKSAFYGSSLKQITIPSSVKYIGTNIFGWCFDLTNITVDTNNKYYSSNSDGVLFNKDKTTLISYPMGHARTEYTVPNTVRTIEEYAFYYSQYLTNITIPNSVTSIEDCAFLACVDLESINFSKSITHVGKSAFEICSNLSDVYYTGNETEWGKIYFDEYNEDLTNAKIHYNSNYSSEDSLITRVKQYTFEQQDDFYTKLNKFSQTNSTTDYNALINAYNLYGNSQKEMHDFQMLTNNELYVAWQFKETVNKPFAKYGLGAARLIYSGDVWQYSAGNNPYEQRYTTALRKFIEESAPETEFTLYQQLWYNFLSSNEIRGEFVSFGLDISDILPEIMKATDLKGLNKFLRELELDKIVSSGKVMKISSILSDFSPLLDIFSLGLSISNLTTEKLIELFNIMAKLDAYYEYSEMFAKVSSAENLPDGLRNAAHTVSLQIDGQISKIAADLKKGIEAETTKTAFGISIDIVAMLTSEVVGTVAAGINIGVLMSNAFLGFTDTLNSVCYIEAYAMISEFYSNELIKLRNSFNADPTLGKAQEFKREYEFLRSMRIAGEKAYLEMSKHENMYNSLFKMAIIVLCNYYKKAVFVKESVESLEHLAFTMKNDEFIELPCIEDISDKITIACPVNVYIYDKDNNLVCAVENNEVSYCSETSDTLPKVIVIEETKHIFIPENSDFRIQISAYDDGTVTCSVDSFGGEDYSKVNYYDIPVSTGSVCVLNTDNSGNYGSLTKDGKTIDESEYYSGSENSVPSINVNATTNGLGYVSVGNKYAKGELVGLIATPKEGAEFLYWIINGEKVAKSAEVYFIAKESIDAVAVFSCKDKISINNPTNHTVNYGDTLILSAQLSNADTSANIIWVADSDAVILTPSKDGKTCAVKPLKSGNVEIKAYLADDNGNVIFDNDETNAESSIKITTKAGFFQIIISFFKNLFGINRIIY